MSLSAETWRQGTWNSVILHPSALQQESDGEMGRLAFVYRQD